jgi:hypothetical protein
MCPACLASAALIAGSVVSTGGVSAIVIKLFRRKKNGSANDPEHKTERRNEDGNANE